MKNKVLTTITDYVIMFVGAVLYAASVNTFTSPNDIAPGGLTGVGTMLNHLFSLPIGVMILVLNIPLFIWGAIENGKKFLTKTIVATVFVSIIIDVMAPFSFKYEGDTLLASIFGGLLSGVGLALIFFRGGTTGGTDIIARNIHKHFPHVSMGTVILAADAVVFVAAAFTYHSIESALYAVITVFVSTKVIDTVIYGVAHDNGKLMFIVTDKYEELSQEIIARIGRGVTQLDAHGAYNNDSKKVLLCAVRPSQVHKTKVLVNSIDENAFIVVTTANAISGKGFATSENS
ncbi:MAG: YitT family protein [Ruminococcaceae bacterium]|nr:YitT family protein [Oscillospiraceae bacterium]